MCCPTKPIYTFPVEDYERPWSWNWEDGGYIGIPGPNAWPSPFPNSRIPYTSHMGLGGVTCHLGVQQDGLTVANDPYKTVGGVIRSRGINTNPGCCRGDRRMESRLQGSRPTCYKNHMASTAQ